ncbi:MAG: ABC transporter, partial [Elusimicrobia bacterium]
MSLQASLEQSSPIPLAAEIDCGDGAALPAAVPLPGGQEPPAASARGRARAPRALLLGEPVSAVDRVTRH